ncbi:MAG: hypothetical protein AB1Y26_09635 [Cycloclasticus sp.]
MEFINKKLALVVSIYEAITYLFARDFNIVITSVLETYQASLMEITMPLWEVVLLIITPVCLIALWDYRHLIKKKKVKPIELNKLDQDVMEYFLGASELEKFTADTVAEELDTSIPDMRKTLVWLDKHSLVEKDYEGYYISNKGVLAYRALGA